MEFFPPVVFEVKAKVNEALVGFGLINKELTAMEKNGLLANASVARLERTMKIARTAAIGLGGAFGVLAITSLDALGKLQTSQAKLETAVSNTGVSFSAAKPIIDDHAESMKKLGFTYDETYAALATMTAASGSPKMALDTLSVAADLARFKQISLADAGRLLARASIGQAKGLGDLGIAIGKTIPKGASLATILKAVEDRAGGAAQKFGDTLPGKLRILQASFEELQVKLGTALLPTAQKLTDWVIKTALPSLEKFGKWFSDNKTVITQFGAALAGLWIGSKIAAGISATIVAVNALRDAWIAVGIAEAFATGGISAGLGLTAVAAIVGTAVATKMLHDVLSKKTYTPSALPFQDPTNYAAATPNLTGKPVKIIAKPSTTTSGTTVLQNVTVYASNTNDISKNLSKAAKNGIPVVAKR